MSPNTTPSRMLFVMSSMLYAVHKLMSSQILAFLSDYNDALSRSEALDNQLTSAASGISSEYSDLIALASRQAFGGIDITVSNATGGGWNTSDVMIFMKNIGIDR